MTNENIFTIVSLLDYNNNILIENNLSHYIFHISNLHFLYYIKNEDLSLTSFSIDGQFINTTSKQQIIMLEKNSDYSSESITSNDSYVTKKIVDLDQESNDSFDSNNSFDSKISFDSNQEAEFLSQKSYCSNNSNNSIDSKITFKSDYSINSKKLVDSNQEANNLFNSFDSKMSFNFDSDISYSNSNCIVSKSLFKSNNQDLKNIIQNDYDTFYYYICKLDQLKFTNLSLYQQLTNKLIFLNLQKIQTAFFNLL